MSKSMSCGQTVAFLKWFVIFYSPAAALLGILGSAIEWHTNTASGIWGWTGVVVGINLAWLLICWSPLKALQKALAEEGK